MLSKSVNSGDKLLVLIEVASQCGVMAEHLTPGPEVQGSKLVSSQLVFLVGKEIISPESLGILIGPMPHHCSPSVAAGRCTLVYSTVKNLWCSY